MRRICYTIQSGQEDLEKTIPYTEANMAIAEAEAWGEITVEDDGKPEPEDPVSTDARVQALEAKLEAMEAAYTEGVEHA